MPLSYKDLKNNFKKNQEALLDELSKMKKKYNDDRFWKVTVDERTGNGSAIIRFLPSRFNEIPFVTYYEYAFKGPTDLWYIEKSLRSLNKPDPLGELNSKLWATGIEANRDIVRKRKQKQVFISNIYVIKDPKHPENEGKVFLFKYGKKIMEKIQDAYSPEFDDQPRIDAFDMWQGANFLLRVKKGEGGFPNYDSSAFDTPSPLLGGDDKKLEEIFNQTYDLNEFIAPETFKTYEELKARLEQVLGEKLDDLVPNTKSVETKKVSVTAKPKTTTKKEEVVKVTEEKENDVPWATDEIDEDDDMNELNDVSSVDDSDEDFLSKLKQLVDDDD
jgi:hypothetical protein